MTRRARRGRGTAQEATDAGWNSQVARFLEMKAASGTAGELWLRRLGWELRRVPPLLGARLNRPTPRRAADVTSADILAIRTGMRWEKPTFAIHFAALRQFLRWAGNPVAEERRCWLLPSGEPSHRRWLTRSQLQQLLVRNGGTARLMIAFEALNGLRRVEVLRLRAKDILLEEGLLRVLGKGRNGGKWRRIPLQPLVRRWVEAWLVGRGADDRVVPLSRSGADLLLRRATRRAGLEAAGIRVSHHDLRRTFGRLAARAGMSLVQIKNVFGHASVDMTAHYIGLDADEMREGLTRLNTLVQRGRLPRGATGAVTA